MGLPTIRVGIVGAGFMGKMHAHAYRSLPFYYAPPVARVVLAGIAARSEASLARAVEDFGFESATADFRELCARPDIDLIDCAVPNDLHRDVVLAALEGGKHVYVDKPLATTLEDATVLARAAERARGKNPRLVTRMAFQYRFVPALLRAKELVEDGALGDVSSARVAYLHAGYVDPARPFSWRLDATRSGKGGALFDLGAHAVDLALHLLGGIRSVCHAAETFVKERPLPDDPSRRARVEVDDLSVLLCRLDGGGIATIESSRVATGSQDELRIEAHGTRGAIRWSLMQPNFLEHYDATRPEGPLGGDRGFRAIECVGRYPKPAALPGPKNTVGWERFQVHSIHELLRSIVDGAPARPDILDGARVQAVLEAALRSSERGGWVDVPALSAG